MRRSLVSVLLAACTLAGCAAVSMSDQTTMVIEAATTASPESLRQKAESGDAFSQLALSVVLGAGLRGERVDRPVAATLRGRAVAPRGFVNVTTYTAPLGGRPGSVKLLPVAQRAFQPSDLAAIDNCIQLLEGRLQQARTSACGDAARHERLARLWSSAKAR